MSSEYKMQLQEAIDKATSLELKNEGYKNALDMAYKTIENRDREVEIYELKIAKLQDIIKAIIDTIQEANYGYCEVSFDLFDVSSCR